MARAVIGFDTGPGNALMDDYMRLYCDADFDKDGALAASGIADATLVDAWLDAPYFTADWPKSLDRQAFRHCLDDARLLAKAPADAMASLALLTANSIAAAIDQLPAPPRTILIAGGGRRNLCLYGAFAKPVWQCRARWQCCWRQAVIFA